MNREGKKCVLYPRVSTEMQVDGYSLEGQKNGLKRFADREEMEIVGIYEDAGKSGKSIEGRPAFKKMLSDIGNGLEIDYILVYKLSRFGRNAADILNSLEYVQSYGVNLICIEEGIDSSQTSGKLLISVLSAVAEIERENIIEQTMNGRREKARQGGWNGGFAPYGYYLKDNQLLIEESEAAAIRIIFEKFAGSDIGYGGIAKYLNLQGIKKIPRQNGTLENWSGHLVRQILDNPVYCGKIAYGRRTREKVKGTKNEYKQVHAEEYILEDGQHEGIVSEELWQKVHAKRVATGIKQPSKTGKDRSHLLTGVLKCPLCGSPMYTNKHAWTNKDGTYKEVYYYICGRNKQERGHYCEYKASLRKTDIEPLVIEAIRELVSDKSFAKEIKKRFGVQTDTSKIDKELANYESKLKEVDLNKARLEREIDNLPADAKYRERKIHDMTIRLDGLYDTIVELEERIEDAKLRRSSIEMEAITLENVYRIMEKSTYNRRERPVYGHCGWSRGRFYYRITTFEGRPWDARDPHKTTFMALKHAIRLSIWRKQKETPGVEKAPGVSLPQRKESGRSGRDDGELRFGVRPGHPRKAVTSISQAEALAHGLTHLHHLVFAAVLARELDWCAALQDAREDARPWGVVGIGLRSDVWVEVRRDNHRPAVLVTRVDDVVDMPHDVIGAAVRPQVVDDEEVILEEARLRLLALVERHRLDVGHDVLHAGLQRGEPEVDDPVGDCRGIERLTCAHLSPEEQPIHVIA